VSFAIATDPYGVCREMWDPGRYPLEAGFFWGYLALTLWLARRAFKGLRR